MLSVLRLLAPITPFITEELYEFCFASRESWPSIHVAPWPHAEPCWPDPIVERTGDLAVGILEIIRRRKTEANLSPGTPIGIVRVAPARSLEFTMGDLIPDLAGAARAKGIEIVTQAGKGWDRTRCGGAMVSVDM